MSSRKVRVKKLSVKTVLPVLREDQIDPSEYEALTTDNLIATGVEQAEENEYHLQTILKDAGTSNDQEIPVPPPQESDIDYDALYPSSFHQPSSYIRFSQTVEECISCQYDMSVEDDDFLKSYNGKSPQGGALSEDDFEHIMEVFEDTATEQTPFASVDNTVVAYDMMVPGLNHLGSPTILLHAKAIYEYWKTRRQELGNKPLHASLKFEMHQETDDTDPYVCFRRREARQTRKTRARDNKIAETLKRLRRELEDGRQLVLLSYEREMQKRELLHMDRALFEERARLKYMKVKLNIRDPDDDLVNQKPQKRKAAEPAAAQRPQGTQLRAPVRQDGRSLEQELVLLSDLLTQKERELREEIESKVANHRRWNQNHIDLTREPLPPVKKQGPELKFRPAKTQYLMTPPASISSESMEVDEDAPEPMAVEKRELPVFQFKAGSMTAEQSQTNQPAFRRRIGRLQRLWIDRRGMTTPPRETSKYSDRWKYDSDDDEVDPPVYEIDPFDTRALKFRATIPLGQYMYRSGRPSMPPEAAAGGPTGNRALPPSQAAITAAAAAQAQAQAQTAS
ncbi:Enhancer of polycomb-like protein 1 [Purpureocillium takamizusanense]|uniref:Enhancer of polycomb-like protein n=1 Tax=Purpureocillium takamizusanense TaxID=2060973 RepID=A0A9Q8QGA5_9HYPO|nr:Enhancer of polycomb-like protein 1 [Purpureocillium takamizusanense]UNI19095.1 Enhancer of polycomb-like protein 1 [Purpureocillium takamizusanense]